MEITKAVSDENRVRMLMCLKESELCVCQIIELIGLAPSTVSKHMSILHKTGLVRRRKEGRWIYYSLPAQNERESLTEKTFQWITEALETDPVIVNDAKQIQEILKLDKEELCRRILE